MADSEPQFDPVAFAWLHAKAEQNQLTDEEIAELREQIEAFQRGVSGIFEALINPINEVAQTVRDFARIMSDGQDPRVAEIHKRQRDRHDHTDETPRCDSCGGHLPKVEQGHNRRLCPNCGSPVTYWVE